MIICPHGVHQEPGACQILGKARILSPVVQDPYGAHRSVFFDYGMPVHDYVHVVMKVDGNGRFLFSLADGSGKQSGSERLRAVLLPIAGNHFRSRLIHEDHFRIRIHSYDSLIKRFQDIISYLIHSRKNIRLESHEAFAYLLRYLHGDQKLRSAGKNDHAKENKQYLEIPFFYAGHKHQSHDKAGCLTVFPFYDCVSSSLRARGSFFIYDVTRSVIVEIRHRTIVYRTHELMVGVIKPDVIRSDYGYDVYIFHRFLEPIQFFRYLFRTPFGIAQDLSHLSRRLSGVSQIYVPLDRTVMDTEIYAEDTQYQGQ